VMHDRAATGEQLIERHPAGDAHVAWQRSQGLQVRAAQGEHHLHVAPGRGVEQCRRAGQLEGAPMALARAWCTPETRDAPNPGSGAARRLSASCGEWAFRARPGAAREHRR
jgi:hypothetical protein